MANLTKILIKSCKAKAKAPWFTGTAQMENGQEIAINSNGVDLSAQEGQWIETTAKIEMNNWGKLQVNINKQTTIIFSGTLIPVPENKEPNNVAQASSLPKPATVGGSATPPGSLLNGKPAPYTSEEMFLLLDEIHQHVSQYKMSSTEDVFPLIADVFRTAMANGVKIKKNED